MNIPLVSEKYPYAFNEEQEKQEYKKEVIQNFYDFYQKQQGSSRSGKHYIIVHRNHRTPENPEATITGLCEITDVREFPPFGLTIFGNLRFLDECTFRDMQTARLPYLSIESRDNGVSGEIDSVALLSNAEPKFCYHAFTPETLKDPKEDDGWERFRRNQKDIDDIFIQVKHGGIMPDQNTIAGNPSLTQNPLSAGGSAPKTMAPPQQQNVAPAALSQQQPPAVQQNPMDVILQTVQTILKTLTDHIAKGDSAPKTNESEKKDGEYMEEKKNEKETVEQATSINPNMCSRRLVTLARNFPTVEIETLEKLEKAGMSDVEISKLVSKPIENKENKKEMFVTVGEKKDEKKDETPLTDEEKEVAKELEIYNRQNNKNIKLSKSLVDSWKKIKETR